VGKVLHWRQTARSSNGEARVRAERSMMGRASRERIFVVLRVLKRRRNIRVDEQRAVVKYCNWNLKPDEMWEWVINSNKTEYLWYGKKLYIPSSLSHDGDLMSFQI
jgi:hypothetical protein